MLLPLNFRSFEMHTLIFVSMILEILLVIYSILKNYTNRLPQGLPIDKLF